MKTWRRTRKLNKLRTEIIEYIGHKSNSEFIYKNVINFQYNNLDYLFFGKYN